ncbi:MAG: histidine kinase [Bacteroidales bacterium]|nr:histidine kinase [Bacteroidales bacterium]
MKQSWRAFIRTFWLSPWFIALPVALMVIFMLPDIFDKYTLKVEKNGPVHKLNGYEYYDDLDGDGNSEQIVLFNNSEGKASLKILDHLGFIKDHFYFTGQIILKVGSLTSGIYDSTGKKGIFLMTKSNDSIFMHGIAPLNRNKMLFHDLLITILSEQNGDNDYNLGAIQLFDLDHDGLKEIVSGIQAGFQAQPRFIYSFNLKTDSLIKTTPMLACQDITDTADLDRDGYPELIASSYSIDNNKGRFKLPCDDNSAWLLVYNRHLEFFFPAVQFLGEYIELEPVIVMQQNKHYLFVLHEPRIKGVGLPKLMLFSARGNFIRERILDDDSLRRTYELFRSDALGGRVFLIREGGIVEEYDTNLQVVKRIVIEDVTLSAHTPFDIDGDGRPENRFYADEGTRIIFTEADFSNPVSLNNPFENTELHYQSIRESGKRGKLFIQHQNRRIICSYEPNPLHYFKYPVYLTVYLLILGFVMLVQYLQRRRTRQLVNAQQKISEMQLLLLNDQLDPHFTFNAINSISASILDEKPEEANRNLLSLSRLMRSFVLHHDKLSRTLAEELDFLQNYLVLIHTRLNAAFTYMFDIGEEVDLNVQVPKMITQIFVENAIKHGLKPLKESGELKVIVRQHINLVTIDITDNGIGRKEAGKQGEQGAGKGMTIIDQSVKIINKYNQKKIQYLVADLTDEHANSAGTRVSITIPVGMNYSFTKT